jgi:hypothetical protein
MDCPLALSYFQIMIIFSFWWNLISSTYGINLKRKILHRLWYVVGKSDIMVSGVVALCSAMAGYQCSMPPSSGLWARKSGVQVLAGAGNFSLHHHIQTSSRAHPASYPMDNKGSFSGVKQLGSETDYSPLPSTEVKNMWSYTSTPLLCINGMVLI